MTVVALVTRNYITNYQRILLTQSNPIESMDESNLCPTLMQRVDVVKYWRRELVGRQAA